MMMVLLNILNACEDADEVEEEEGDAMEVDAFDLAEPVDAYSKMPENFSENLASTKWKDRKEALEALHAVLNVPRIKDGPFDEVVRGLAKSMKDANIAVVTVAANCVEALAKGLKRGFGKYRSTVTGAIMERLKEKKQSVADALGQALDAVFASTSLTDCLEDILEFLKHKNPQVKLETLKFLIRCLKTTREAPSKAETKSIAEAVTKLLTDSLEATRLGGAEVLGTLMKIMGERAMNPYMDSLDDIRKVKVKEYFDAAEVKAKDKPKPVAPPPKAAVAPPGKKKVIGKKAPSSIKKPAAAPAAAPPPFEEAPPTPLQPKPTTGRNIPKLGGQSKSNIAAPGGLKPPKKLTGPGGAAPPHGVSPSRNLSPPTHDDQPIAAPKLGLAGRSLAGRPLGKPTPTPFEAPAPSPPPGMTAQERAELEELRADKIFLQRTNEELRAERSKLTSQIHDLQNHNAQLIEDHTRDVLSIKAKETQLVRARSDAELAEQTVLKQQREIDRLKRELGRAMRPSSPASTTTTAVDGGGNELIYRDGVMGNGTQHFHPGIGRYDSAPAGVYSSAGSARTYVATSPSEEKENGSLMEASTDGLGVKTSPARSIGMSSTTSGRTRGASPASMTGPVGRASPMFAGAPRARRDGGVGERDQSDRDSHRDRDAPVESWKRAAEVTSALKARIELMKVCF